MAKASKHETKLHEEIPNEAELTKKKTKKAKKAPVSGSKSVAKKPAAKKAGSKTAKPKAAKKAHKSSKSTKSTKSSKSGETRYFKLIDPSTKKSYGRYTGATPKQAASKGFTKIVQSYKEKGTKVPAKLSIYLRESTRGSLKKVYGYSAARQKLDNPQTLNITDAKTGQVKEIVYEYRNSIKKDKAGVPEQLVGGASKKKKATKAKKAKKATTKTAGKKVTKAKKPKASGSKTAKPKKAAGTKKPKKSTKTTKPKKSGSKTAKK